MRETEGAKETKEVTHKVGIKLLSDVQLHNTFPGFDDLWRKIEDYRKVNIKSIQKRRYQDTLMYDNVFSVLGERGTGKTSVLYTLSKRIEDEYKGDLVLPVIMPEIIPEECDILDWVLAVISEKLEHLEEKQEMDYAQRCHVEYTENLRKKLKKICELSFSVKYNPNSEHSFYEVVSNSERQAQNAFSFARELTEFWTELAEMLRKNNRAQKDDNENAMIYFFFDDVDLAPERVNNLFSVVTKYLAHPNIIVIITADENQIMEVTEINITNRMRKLPKEWQIYLEKNSVNNGWLTGWEQVDINYRDYESARAYLLKILPTSTRYYLKEFSRISEKENFIIVGDVSLNMAVKDLISQLYFDGRRPDITDSEIAFYFQFIGNSSRQMGNAYHIMRQFLEGVLRLSEQVREEKKTRQMYIKDLYESMKQFVYLILRSNTEKFDKIGEEEEFTDKFLLYQYNQWDMYINYRYIPEFYGENMDHENERAGGYGEKKKAFMDMAIALYALGFFLDRVLLLLNEKVKISVCPGRQKYYAQNELSGFINRRVFSNRKMIRTDMNMQDFLGHYEDLFREIGRLYKFERNNAGDVYDYLHCFDRKQWKGNRSVVKKLFYREREWFENILAIVSMACENVYIFGSELSLKTDIMSKELELDFVATVRKDVRAEIEDFICRRKLRTYRQLRNGIVWQEGKRKIFLEEVMFQTESHNHYIYLGDVYEKCKEMLIQLKLESSENPEMVEDIILDDMVYYCSENTAKALTGLLRNVGDIGVVEEYMEELKDSIEYQYRKYYNLVEILDEEEYFESMKQVSNSEAEGYEVYRKMIEQEFMGGQRVFNNRILNFARNVKNVLDRTEQNRESEEQSRIYENYTLPYHRILKSVAVCIPEERLEEAIDFCLDIITYLCVVEWYLAGRVVWKEQGGEVYTAGELFHTFPEQGNAYYVMFYRICEKIMNARKEKWIGETLENIVNDARQEYVDYILG